MMRSQSDNSYGISEVVSVILVIALMIALAIVVYVLVFGQLDPKYMQKTVYIAGNSAILPLGSKDLDYVLTYSPKAGDDFYFVGQMQGRGTPVTMKLLSPDGRNLTPDTSGLTGVLYGKTLYIYQKIDSSNACEYIVKESVPPIPPGIPTMVKGTWKLQLIDEKIHVLADTYTETFTKGTSSIPVTILQGTGIGGKSYRADCSVSNGTCGTKGCPPQFNTSPCNKTYSKFNGSTYITFTDDPTLKYTGDLSISVSIKPTDNTSWHQVMGKGYIDPAHTSSEFDNYQIFQINDNILFEWNDKNPPNSHYQAITTTRPIIANSWNDITVTVNGGVLTVYCNGMTQNLVYHDGNSISHQISPPGSPPIVRLMDNGNSVMIGKQQADPPNEFFFSGDIGGVSLYNRALTPDEINKLLCTTA